MEGTKLAVTLECELDARQDYSAFKLGAADVPPHDDSNA